MEKYKNIPPKDIQNAIWGQCFDYKDFDEEVLGEPIEIVSMEHGNTSTLLSRVGLRPTKKIF